MRLTTYYILNQLNFIVFSIIQLNSIINYSKQVNCDKNFEAFE